MGSRRPRCSTRERPTDPGDAITRRFEGVLDPDRIVVSGQIPAGPQGGSAKYFVVDKPTHDVRGEFTLPSASDRMQAFPPARDGRRAGG